MILRLAVIGVLGTLLIAGCQTSRPAGHHDSAAASGVPCEASRAAAANAPVTVTTTFGAPQKLGAADAVPVSKVLANPAAYRDQYVRLTGKVTDVCPKKGCWVRVADADAKPGADDIFIKFPDPPAGMYVPREAVGRNATVEGTLKLGMMSEKSARHFKEDAGATAEEIANIVGPQKQAMITQASVAIEGIQPPAAGQ